MSVLDEAAEERTSLEESGGKPWPMMAAFLSLLFPGLGYAYGRAWKRGAMLLGIYALVFPVMLVAFCEWNLKPWNVLPLALWKLLAFWFVLDSGVATARVNKLAGPARGTRLARLGAMILVAGVLTGWVFLVRAYVVQLYSIPSESMRETLMVGDHIAVDKYSYVFGEPKRGDVIVLIPPSHPEMEYIKRIIGVPGDSVDVRQARVAVNGQVLSETYAKFSTSVYGHRAPDQTYTVPKDAYFVLGDNRDNSEDSRVWGFLPRELIRGRVRRVYFSLDQQEFDRQLRESMGPGLVVTLPSAIRWSRIGQTVE